MKTSIVFIIMHLPFLLAAQDYNQNNGINFEQTSNWKEAIEKARSLNKYIFVDIFATWCGPCKKMEKDIYTVKEVSDLMNNNYFSLKVQIDTTPTDNQFVRSWYADASSIKQKYHISAFPTYLFFSPSGEIVHKGVGYLNVSEFVSLAAEALKKDKQYYTLLQEFFQGRLDLYEMPYLISMAIKLNDLKSSDTVSKAFYSNMYSINPEKVYKRDVIDYIASTIKSSSAKVFGLFYPNGEKVDHLMSTPGFSRGVVDKVIKIENTNPTLTSARKQSKDPNWDSLYEIILNKYNPDFADRAILAAKVRWYESKKKWDLYVKYFIKLVNCYGIESLLIYRSLSVSPEEKPKIAIDGTLNYFSWEIIFKRSTDKREINFAIRQMKGVVYRSTNINLFWAHLTRDTYANLIYKAGDLGSAIKWEKEAVKYANEADDPEFASEYKKTIEKMYKGEPTWK